MERQKYTDEQLKADQQLIDHTIKSIDNLVQRLKAGADESSPAAIYLDKGMSKVRKHMGHFQEIAAQVNMEDKGPAAARADLHRDLRNIAERLLGGSDGQQR